MDKSDVDTVQLNVNDLQQDNEDEIDSCGAGDGALDTKRSFSQLDSLSDQDGGFNDTGDFAEDGFDGKESDSDRKDDPILNEIRDSIARCHSSAKSHTSSSDGAEGSPHVKVANKFVSLPYGLVPWASYEHGKRSGDIMGVTYNGRMRQFIILDSKGITSWKRDAVEHRVCRDLHYPKYEYRLITNVIYAKKHNCYFVLGKDFSLKVYNRDFYETCSVSADLRSVLFMLFNPLRDELITGGVGGTKVWRFHQQSGITPTMLRPLANYGLTLKYELPSVGGSWVKRVELDHHLEHLYCCSDTDLHVYDLSGKLLFKFERAHMMSITGCRYSQAASVLVTSSIDCEVKVWSLMGGLIHTFRGHSRAVTNLLLHPATSSIVLTCSLDGTVRMWSLDTMDCIYSLVVSADGLLWMGLTDDNMLFISTARAVTLWHMNYTVQFWALARSRVTHMELCGCKEKTTRLMAISEDSSVRLMARSNRKNLCTVLPPPSISPLQRVLSVCYSREFNTIYMLINPHEIWVYTTRTDPACRIAVWDVVDVQASFSATKNNATSSEDFNPSSISVNKPAPSHRATESGAGVEPVANCCCLAILNSTAIVWTDEGCCCPIRDSYLLLGLEDGRILFMDPVRKGHKYLEFKTGKDPVLDMYHDTTHQALVTVYKLPGMMQIHVWGLPDLELQHEVYTCPDLRGHARLGYLLVTAHESGSVMFHSMELATDPGLHKPKMVPVLEEVVDVNHKPQHQAPVIALDVCTALRIFCSCSKDGAIKIWTEDEALLTEIMLDDSLTSACFLNNMGDIVVGFQKQVFFIDHSKVCSQLTIPESDVDTFDKESFICEDPAVMYEGVSPNPDPVTLNNYLVPFDIEFSKDFLEGRVKLEPEVAKEEESDDESAHSQAPTEIYFSPAPTPRRRLSLVDLTLGSGVTQHELLNHMKKTIEHLAQKEQADVAQVAFELKQEEENQEANRRRRRLARMRGSVDKVDAGKSSTDGGGDSKSKPSTEQDEYLFSFPRFGVSPGPSPRSTPSHTPEEMSGAEDLDLEEDVLQDETSLVKMTTMQVAKPDEDQDDEISKFLAAEKEKEKEAEEVKQTSPRPKRKFGFSTITVDAKSLMKEGKKTAVSAVNRKPGSEVTSPRKATDSDSDTGEENKKSKRSERGSKKMGKTSQRKTLRSRKPEKEIPSTLEPPPTQMQTLEQKESMRSGHMNEEFNSMAAASNEDTDFIDGERPKAGAKRRPASTAQKTANFDEDSESKKDTTGSQDIPIGTLDGRDGKVETAQNLTEQIVKAETPEAKAVSPKPSELLTITPKPGSAKSRLSSAKNSSGVGGDVEDIQSFVSSEKDQGQSLVFASVIGERSVADARSDVGTRSGVAESFDRDGRKSALSTEGSEDSKTAFRLSLLTKEPCVEETVSEEGPADSASSGERSRRLSAQTQELAVQNAEPFVRDCHRDSQDGQSDPANKPPPLKLKKPGGHKSSSNIKPRSTVGHRSPQSKSSLALGGRGKPSKPKVDANPEVLLSAYFDKQKAKEISKNAPHVLSVTDAEELLNAVGRKKPPSPILEDEGAEEEEENQTEAGRSARPSLDWTSGKVHGSRQSTTSSLPETLSRQEFAAGRTISPDSSTMRATTPSVSIIENESMWSVSSPAPSIGRGFSSPLPTLSEIPLASSPIPVHKAVLEERSELDTNVSGSKVFPASNQLMAISEDREGTPHQNASLNEKGHLSTLSMSSISLVAESMATSSHKQDRQISKDVSSRQSVEDLQLAIKSSSSSVDLNQARTEMSKSSLDRSGREDVSDEDVSDSSAADGSDKLSDKKVRRKYKTVPSPVEKIDIVRRQSSSEVSLSTIAQSSVANTIPEEDENIELNIQEVADHQESQNGSDVGEINNEINGDVFKDGKDFSDGESSERTWDSDFDASYMGSVGELSSSLSASDEDSKARSRGGGSASSSSNTEQLMKVKIRRKQLSHHRQRRPDRALQQQQTQSPRDASIALRRMLSQSDALTVQRNAQIGRARFERKRAKSAAESSFGAGAGAGKPEHIHQCVLCAAEGSGQHAEHSKSKPPVTPGEGNTEKEKRRISFKEETKPSSVKPSPRLPRSGRSSVSLQSPRETGSRRSSLTQPSPRDNGSRRSSITQPSPGGSEAKRLSLGYSRSQGGRKASRPGTEEEGRLAKTPDISTTPLLTPDPRPSGTPDASTRDRTTPTSIETPELSGYARPSSQILSDAAFASPRDSEALREGVESVSEIRSAVPDYPDGVGTPDSAWMDQDIISVSRQHVRSADQHVTSSDLDDTSEFHGAQSGLGLMSQDGRQTALGDVTPEVKVIRSRPNTSVEDRALQKPELQSALTFFKQRPHTAQVRFRTEDLQSAFDTSLVRYKKLSRNPMTSDTLYRNSDQAFSEDWHERQVERHMLIRMQKELRSQNAERRRLAMQAQRQDLLQRRLHAQETQLFHRRAHPHSSAPPPPTTPTVPARASTVHGSRPSAMTGPAPSPVVTRPHTAAGPGIHRHQHHQSHFYQQQQQQQQQQHHRPSQYSGESIARQLEAEAGRRLKAELSNEKPFRFKLRGTEADSCAPAVIDLGETIDPWLLDPRNPQAVRPKSSKSIPSKCHRYVLVTKPKAHLQIPLPSPLEEQLLATRFPQQGEKVFRQYEGLLFRPQRRPEYGINYSPFEHQLYG